MINVGKLKANANDRPQQAIQRNVKAAHLPELVRVLYFKAISVSSVVEFGSGSLHILRSYGSILSSIEYLLTLLKDLVTSVARPKAIFMQLSSGGTKSNRC